MSDRLRLRDVDLEALAAEAGQQLLQDATAKLATLQSGELTEALRALNAYARGEQVLSENERKRLTELVALLWTSPLGQSTPKPDSAIGVLVAAVEARAGLRAGRDLSCAEVALLTGYTSDHVASIAEEIPGHYRDARDRRKPWRFRASAELRRWIRDRAI